MFWLELRSLSLGYYLLFWLVLLVLKTAFCIFHRQLLNLILAVQNQRTLWRREELNNDVFVEVLVIDDCCDMDLL